MNNKNTGKSVERQLEDHVGRLIKSMGYTVSSNPRLRGRSGLHHRPDFMFEVKGKKFIVECKTHFFRQDVLSVYGMATDLDVSHVFLVGYRFPELEVYEKAFDLTLLILQDSVKSKERFKNSIRRLVSRVLLEEEKSRRMPLVGTLELNSYYFLATKTFDLNKISTSMPKGNLSTSTVSDHLIRIDFDGPNSRVLSFLRAVMKEAKLQKLEMLETGIFKTYLQAIEEAYNARIVRFGMMTQRTYVVTNIRSTKDKIGLDELEHFLFEKRGRLTSIRLRLANRSYVNITRTPSLRLGYRGKTPEIFFDVRKEFERLPLGG